MLNQIKTWFISGHFRTLGVDICSSFQFLLTHYAVCIYCSSQQFALRPSQYEAFVDDKDEWISDKFFTQQRLAGVNPMSLMKVTNSCEGKCCSYGRSFPIAFYWYWTFSHLLFFLIKSHLRVYPIKKHCKLNLTRKTHFLNQVFP